MATIKFIDAPFYQETNTPEGYQLYTDAIPVFLIGPILGTWEWQEYVKARLQHLVERDQSDLQVVVYNPRRPDFKSLNDFDDGTFFDQVDWEHSHLYLTGIKGVKLAWLANKTVEMPNRNYCLTTLFELGELIGATTVQKHAVVGIEPGFTNEKYLHYTIEKKAPEVLLTSNLDHACDLVMQELLKLKQQK